MGTQFRDFLWGLFVFDLYRETVKAKLSFEDSFNLLLLGEFLGLPLMNAPITLRLLPYLMPRLGPWRQKLLTEKDIFQNAPEVH